MFVGPVALSSKLEERKILNIIVVVNWRRGKRLIKLEQLKFFKLLLKGLNSGLNLAPEPVCLVGGILIPSMPQTSMKCTRCAGHITRIYLRMPCLVRGSQCGISMPQTRHTDETDTARQSA